MDYSKLVKTYEYLEKTSARLAKIDEIGKLLKGTDTENLPNIVLLLQGKVFPTWDNREIGIANLLMINIIHIATGYSKDEIKKKFNKIGDFGLIIEKMMEKKKQQTLFQKKLTIEKVFSNLQKLAGITGTGSQERKFSLVSELLSSAKPKEAKYIVRTVIGDLRIGVAAGVIRDSIAKAYLPKIEKKDAVKAVEWAWFLRPDYGEVALIAKENGMKGLKGVGLKLGEPYHVLLADRSPSLEDALNKFENCVLEYKYDGARIIIQRDGNRVWLFTRSLENITIQFPELVEWAKKALKPKKCIVEGEMLAIDKKTGKPMPFQMLSQRIKRKYDIEKIAKNIPIQVNLFDITYLDGKSLFKVLLRDRWELLKKSVRPIQKKLQLAKHIITKDLKIADSFYKEALAASQEGLIIKNMDAKYQPGRRVGYWLKVKPIMETLDLAIIGAIWGTGKRAGWMGSYILGCKDARTGKFLECGMIGTGIKEKSKEGVSFKDLTKLLKPLIIDEDNDRIEIKPKIVMEVAYEEIQKSVNYDSGYALRFPRVVRMRNLDKKIEQCDTINKLKHLYNIQKGKK
ncbi:MAG: ATP-dependent DNA ligase [Candidatus Aenigmarchaeota archaeon]|nr:ATP-dependent DNA ligase [Candidatus Aenigmarchaeota archaeon]